MSLPWDDAQSEKQREQPGQPILQASELTPYIPKRGGLGRDEDRVFVALYIQYDRANGADAIENPSNYEVTYTWRDVRAHVLTRLDKYMQQKGIKQLEDVVVEFYTGNPEDKEYSLPGYLVTGFGHKED